MAFASEQTGAGGGLLRERKSLHHRLWSGKVPAKIILETGQEDGRPACSDQGRAFQPKKPASAKALRPNALQLLRNRRKVSVAEWCEPVEEQKEIRLNRFGGFVSLPKLRALG